MYKKDSTWMWGDQIEKELQIIKERNEASSETGTIDVECISDRNFLIALVSSLQSELNQTRVIAEAWADKAEYWKTRYHELVNK